jgi:hypothetical protein
MSKTSKFCMSAVAAFLRSSSGVVTVEWVALAAGVAIGAIAISFLIMNGLTAPAGNICTQLGGTAQQCAPAP